MTDVQDYNTETLQNFVQDPNWEVMKSFIREHFDTTTDINDIDTNESNETVKAEIIARQRILSDLENLMNSFNQLEQIADSQETSFK